MSNSNPAMSLPADFSGPVRLFPLPNLVLFPHVIQPLHVFEARYREMTADALAKDSLLALAVLKSNGQTDGHHHPPRIESVACLSRILAHVKLPDGGYNLCLQGLTRVSIIRELPPNRSFRQAEVKLLSDQLVLGGETKRAILKKELLAGFRGQLADAPELLQDLERLLSRHLSLATLTDIIAYATALETSVKISLLSECRVDRRAEKLLELLADEARPEASLDDAGIFPPAFSVN